MALPPARRRLRILVLSWNYPTVAAPQRGLWAERMCDAASSEADVAVIVPTPWVPPLVPVRAIARFRDVPHQERRGRVDVHFPRVPGSIEYLTHGLDARLALPRVLETARRLHAETPFDLIHAHFIYPDGVVAARIGSELGIPVMTSEHAFWTPWLIAQRRVGAQVARALPSITLVTAVSDFLRRGIDEYARGRVATAVLGNVVDDQVFAPTTQPRDSHELLYVGLIRRVKRVDVLLRALAEVRQTMPALRLRILSANAFRAYSTDRREMTRLIESLGLAAAVDVVNGADPADVAAAMRRCAFVTVSSTRRETFCAVAAEAMACGTPLVLTRCGGPEEFVTSEDGVMVNPDDVSAFAAGIREAFARRERFDGNAIHERIVGRFGRDAWTRDAMAVYDRVATTGRPRGH
jgi:teichuronic acid biosynthesis glycosyltransferase TuaC